MQVKNHKLVGHDNRNVPYVKAGTSFKKLTGDKPRFLVIHYTAGSTASGAVNWFKRSNANSSAHLVIAHDGDITQMVPFDTVAWHAGRSSWKNVKGLNSHSVGIEIANWGKLEKSASGGYVSYTGKAIPDSRVIVAAHKNSPGAHHGWEIYDAAQYRATVDAAKAIVEEYGIKPSDLVGHEDISPGRKIDPGPAFDMAKFRSLVYGRAEDDWDDMIYRVKSSSGLNMRSGPGVGHDVLRNLSDGTEVNVIEQTGNWWLVAEIVDGKEDNTGYVHSHWLQPT